MWFLSILMILLLLWASSVTLWKKNKFNKNIKMKV